MVITCTYDWCHIGGWVSNVSNSLAELLETSALLDEGIVMQLLVKVARKAAVSIPLSQKDACQFSFPTVT
jgi:hypothetical protein